ncbi:chemotaxis protein CheW [Leptothoe spongobia]|uniref:Chemotaxis protein CheW n=1 Tax=Leptothoe spongobia TAU-MAC 1115 TaxID=1967444 RepID=A0A947DE79_9CYAN|nr:chemotaxis protein CheW [Leptothoe spongobia]MBT9315442.1 chemotaxis protein CheW [Leptothoe spongobia TAU-MAC 1115]
MMTQVSTKATQTLRLIVMSLGQLTVACNIETVYKVVKRSQIHGSGLGLTGMIHLDGQDVIVVDLHRKLFQVPISEKQGYFVIVKNQAADLIAIPVATSPNLMDVLREQVRILPEAYRQSDTLDLVSHVAVVPDGEQTLTIFVLDENTLI